jgi:hypothetical protein
MFSSARTAVCEWSWVMGRMCDPVEARSEG